METATSKVFYRLYGKGPGMRTFKAMDVNAGAPVGNLMYATFWTSKDQADKILAEVTRMNTDCSLN